MCVAGGRNFNASSTLETSVLGRVDDVHAPITEFLEDRVVSNGLADHEEPLLKHIIDKHEL
jgi:hypothetical protein